jgi:hypothetical protein
MVTSFAALWVSALFEGTSVAARTLVDVGILDIALAMHAFHFVVVCVKKASV